MKINLLQKYKHAWVLLYAFLYFPCFIYLEKHITKDFNVIHMPLDDYIPFLEIFIIPYTLWFAYIAGTILYFFFTDVRAYYKLTAFLFIGMTIFLIVSALYPNGQLLRPQVFPRENIFTDMVRVLYKSDTPTNILPSIHVYNSIGACIAILRCDALKKYRLIRIGAPILSILIILSTMFLKQHSVWDVIFGIGMAWVLYYFIYQVDYAAARAKRKSKVKRYS
ncbi:phosphatase PAP2 family protein [Diplocloster modestus]|uniref:Phosphatase PAP2 family protein n=1 Tax=Diplocloster modestus TaxID=2850322 RepID=A0ABS6K2T3_9FIRM|nr:phosphatase PAP2 family protein [Diplocloster modestus]MBU9724819.1 phosphatase PAP2 family protein [Diplocloster modestus]